jgi:hypothetical protein
VVMADGYDCLCVFAHRETPHPHGGGVSPLGNLIFARLSIEHMFLLTHALPW